MISSRPHVDEQIDAWLDGRLDALARHAFETHLESCARCRRLRDGLLATRNALRKAIADEPVSPAVVGRLRAALDREDAAPTAPAPTRGSTLRRLGWALAAAVAFVALALGLRPGAVSGPSAVDAILAEHERLSVGPLPEQLRVVDAAQLERRWSVAELDFPTRVLDLASMGLHLAGGDAPPLGTSRAARAFYEDATGVLACWMFRAAAAVVPAAAERLSHGGFEFHVFRRAGRTLVLWREGEVVCALVGSGDPRRIVELAFAKAMAPARARET